MICGITIPSFLNIEDIFTLVVFIGVIFVGYEFTIYTTSEDVRQVQVCAVLMAPGPATAPRDFVLSSTTENGTASMSNGTSCMLVWSVQLPFVYIAGYDCNTAMYLSLVQGIDFVGQSTNLMFALGDSESCHTVNILQDNVCEHPNSEDFFANLVYVSGIENINIVRGRTRVLIDDSNESECSEFNANSTYTYVYICQLLCRYTCWI